MWPRHYWNKQNRGRIKRKNSKQKFTNASVLSRLWIAEKLKYYLKVIELSMDNEESMINYGDKLDKMERDDIIDDGKKQVYKI